MHNILMLAIANLRKSKSQTFSMVLLMLMAAMFLNIGIVMYFGLENFFNEQAEELNSAHFVTLQSEAAPSNAQAYFLEQFPGVAEIESQSIIVGTGGIGAGNAQTFDILFIAPHTNSQQMNPPNLIGDSLPLSNDGIYIPHAMFLNNSYTVGENFSFDFMGTELNFTIAGSTEEIMFGAVASPFWRVYVSDEMFQRLHEEFYNNRFTLLSARMEDSDYATLLYADYINEFFGTPYFTSLSVEQGPVALSTFTHDTAWEQRSLVPIVVAIFMTAFSIILLVVGVIVIRFRISNSIEGGITNIGTLKAMGYRNYQIISSIMVQFGITVFVGSLMGVYLSKFVLPLVTQIIEPQLGLLWNPGINFLIMSLSIVIILLVTLVFALIISWRINKLYPLAALRGELHSYNFKKNPLPLDKPRGSLALQLALKQLLQSKKQALMLCLVIGGVTFATAFGIGTYYNLNVNMDAFVNILVGDASDVIFVFHDTEDGREFREKLSTHSEVNNAHWIENAIISVEGITVRAEIVENFSYLEGNSLIGGHFPLSDNEIVLGAPVLDVLDKGIGDRVTVRSDGNEQEYLVTGIVQGIVFNGFLCMVRMDGFMNLQPDFVYNSLHVNLVNGVDSNNFIASITAYEDDIFERSASFQDVVDVQLSAIGDIFAIVTAIILSVVVVVVFLVLYMVIKAAILRKKRELGIQKALGFTTVQLMNQIALSLTPTILLGVIIGSIGGYFGFNPIVVALMRNMGIAQANMTIPLAWISVLCISLALLAYAVSMTIAWRVRKISAYALVTE